MAARYLLIICALGVAQSGLAQSFSDGSHLFLSTPDASIPFSAISVADFNGDGRTDIYHPGRLYRQTADGQFQNILNSSGIDVEGNQPLIALSGDQNADGLLDLVILGARPGSRYYEKVDSDRYRLANSDRNLQIRASATGGVWGDFDADGYMDLLVAAADGQNQLYVSSGDGLFTNVTGTKRTQSPPGGCGLAVSDFDGDLDLDLYIPACAGVRTNSLMLYDSVGDRFAHWASRFHVESPLPSYDAVVLDFDNDGWMDLFVVNARETKEDFGVNPANSLFRNEAGRDFVDVAGQAGIGGTVLNLRRRVAAADFNNDGWTDLYITTFEDQDRLYINQQDGTFVDRLPDLVPNAPPSGIFTAADVNDDGWIDLIYGDVGGHRLLLNSGDAHWVKIGLRSPGNNRWGIGARVEVTTGTLVQTKILVSGGGSISQGQSSNLHFGLGDAAVIDQITVTWPDGTVDTVLGLGVDQVWTIETGGSINAPPPGFALLQPPDAAFFDTARSEIDFSWEPSPDDGTVTYTLSVVGPGTQLRFPNLESPSLAMPTDLLGGNQIYSWSVIASDGLSVGPSAERRQFSFGNPDRASATLEAPALFDFGLVDLDSGDARFLDIDGDRDLDLLIAGTVDGQPVARLYKSVDRDVISTTGGAQYIFKGLVDTGSSILPVVNISMAVGDLDGDGNPDAMISGLIGEDRLPLVTVYLAGAGALQATTSTVKSLWGGPLSIADVDGDGDSDLLVSGSSSTTPPYAPETILYRNTGGIFSEWTRFPGAMFGGADWFDADLDGDLDLVLVGDSGFGRALAAVYRNDGNTFTEFPLPQANLLHSNAVWADYDNDGDGDLLLSGGVLSPELLTGRTLLMNQTSPWNFTEQSTALDGLLGGNAVWGDYENDGDLDIIMVGGRTTLGELVGRVYRNQNGRFVAELDFQGTLEGRVAVGDYNLDGDLDFLVLGKGPQGNATVSFFINQQVAEPVPATR